jgi:NADH:ubiquinone oxidoreductase subunit E
MEEKTKSHQKHIFICTFERAEGSCCFKKGAMELMQNLKNKSRQDSEWKGKISVTRCGCLGFCDEGIAAVLYPHQKYFVHIKPTEADLLSKKLDEID